RKLLPAPTRIRESQFLHIKLHGTFHIFHTQNRLAPLEIDFFVWHLILRTFPPQCRIFIQAQFLMLEVSAMKKFFAILFCVSLVPLALLQTTPQNAPLPAVQRNVQGQTIISNELPAADLTFTPDFQYIGAQVVNLYGNALAEQHLFV